jgi:DNA polymerase epsilon subunit 2
VYSVIKNKVPAEIVQEALAVEGDEENDTSENLMILDHKNVPISVYDPVRKVMVRKGGSERSLQENLESITRIQAFRERFELVEQRVQNNHIFAKRSFIVDETAAARPDLTRISGIRRAEGLVCVLGMLTQPEEGVFYLEDLSARVQVDMTDAEASVGLFTENCIIIVEGVMNESKDVFKAHCLAMPPFEDRPVTCSRFPALAVPTNRKPYTPEELQDMLVEEEKQEGTQLVVLSDVWLDRTRVMSGLHKLFGRFLIACQDAEASGADVFFIFVLMGNFVSQPAVHGVATHRELFDRLAAMLEPMEALLLRSCFVIIPGPNDVVAGNTLMLPRNPLPDAIAKGFKDKIPASTFASSPCRIKFYTQELVLHRDDLSCKLRTFSRKPAEGKELHDHAIKTILCQGHLAPLPLHAAPIDWAYDHALRLYPLPSLLVLGERNSHYEKEYQSSKVTNPGCFAADFSFALYSFVGHELQVVNWRD